MIKFKEANTADDFILAAELFNEYAQSIGVDLEFQNFSNEINNLHIQYSRPAGVIFIVQGLDASALGCFGVRKLDSTVCELKRMYLRNSGRGKGLGKLMLRKSIEIASELGYRTMRLDTLPSMKAAVKLYETMGFYEIQPYRYNPIPGTKYLEIKLT